MADLGTEFHTRIQGTCLKHHLGWAAIKLYDKYGIVLRIETTINNVTELKHYRAVEHRDGATEMKYAPMQKTIYSLPPLRELLGAANQRYLEFLSDLDDPSEGQRQLPKLGTARQKDGRSWRCVAKDASAASRIGCCGASSPEKPAGKSPTFSSAVGSSVCSKSAARPTNTISPD